MIKNNCPPTWCDDKSGDRKQVYYKSWPKYLWIEYGQASDGDTLLSPSQSTGGYWSQLTEHRVAKPEVGGWELCLELETLLLSGPVARLRLSSIVAADALTVAVLAHCDRRMRNGCGSSRVRYFLMPAHCIRKGCGRRNAHAQTGWQRRRRFSGGVHGLEKEF